MTLYELGQEYVDLLGLLEEEHTEDEDEAVRNALGEILLNIDEKAEGYGKVLKQMQADAEALKAEKLRIAARQAAIEAGIERLRNALKSAMLLTGKTKIKTSLFTFGVSSRWKAFLDVPVEEIPDEFKVVSVKADTKGIEKWLKEFNPEISDNNCTKCDWAHLDQVETLTVR